MLKYFCFPSGLTFSVPMDWLEESGITNYVLRDSNYTSTATSESVLVPIADIAPPNLDLRSQLNHGGLDRARLINILKGIVANATMPPIQVMEWPHKQFHYILAGGVHRLHASIVAGFTKIYVEHGWVHEQDRPNTVPK